MARIDAFLAQLVAYEADALHVESGDNLYLVKGDQRRALMQIKPGALANGHIGTLLSEVATPDARANIERSADTAWDYHYGNRIFRIEFAVVRNRFAARVRDVPTRSLAVHELPTLESARDDDLDDTRVGIEALFDAAIAAGASDLHLSAGRAPMVRIDGDMAPLPGFAAPLDPYALQKMIEEIAPTAARNELEDARDADFAYDGKRARFRCNVFRDRTGVGGAFRRIPATPSSVSDLGLPGAVTELCALRRGLILVTGPASSGKSTTQAAMIDWINEHRADHIVTIEEPIEIVHTPKRAVINQRQVGEHAVSFARGLRAASKEDPDVIFIGEMRDADTMQLAMELADTGHLVVASMKAATAQTAIDRILDAFPMERQDSVRALLASTLRGVIAQTLCKRVGGGRVAAFEVLRASRALTSLIRDLKTSEIEAMMRSDAERGSVTLARALATLVLCGAIETEEALACAPDADAVLAELRPSNGSAGLTGLASVHALHA